MTYVWKINCHKWRNVGLIGTWVLITIGLAYTVYGLYETTKFDKGLSCWGNNMEGYNCVNDNGYTLYLEYIFLLGLNGVNIFIMWYVINRKYKILDVKCISNERSSKVEEIPTGFISNEEYFKTKESL